MLSVSVAWKANHENSSNVASSEGPALHFSSELNYPLETGPGDLPAWKFNETIYSEALSSGGLP